MSIEDQEITTTDLCRIANISQAKAKATLAKCKPTRAKGRAKYFRLAEAVQALNDTREGQRERKERLQADLLEAKLARMAGEVLDRKACLAVWGDKLVRVSNTVRGIDALPPKERKRIVTLLRHECARMPDELVACEFPEADFETDDNEPNPKEDHDRS